MIILLLIVPRRQIGFRLVGNIVLLIFFMGARIAALFADHLKIQGSTATEGSCMANYIHCTDEGVWYVGGRASSRYGDSSTINFGNAKSGIRLMDGTWVQHNTNGGADALYLVLNREGQLCSIGRPGSAQTEDIIDAALSPDKSSIIFTLYDGINYEETNKVSYRDTSRTLQSVDFAMQRIVIPLENYAFKKSDESRYGSEVMTKSLSQLRTDRDSLEVKVASTVYAQTARCVFSSNLEYTYQYDTTGKAKNATIPYPADSLFNWSSSHAEEAALREAINKLNSQITNFDFYERELYQSAYPLRRTIIESFRKFTLSLACLIFFFIGAPLGAIIRKGGLGTPVIISILFFVFYWVIDISGKRLANDGAISPFIGTFISSFILIPIGIFLTAKSSSDSGLFNADAYKIFFNKLSDRLKAFRKKTVKKNEA